MNAIIHFGGESEQVHTLLLPALKFVYDNHLCVFGCHSVDVSLCTLRYSTT